MFNGQFGEGNQGQALPLTRLPLFFGNPEKDVLTAELWVQRVQSAAAGAEWNNVQTMAHVYGALRAKAIIWYESCQEQMIPNFDNFELGFKPRFLKMFGKNKTTNASIALFEGLKQRNGEGVSDFYLRVSRAVTDMKHLLPAVAIPDVAHVAELPHIPDAFAVAATAQQAIDWFRITNLNAEMRALNTMANNFLVAGVRKDFRDKILLSRNIREMQFFELNEALIEMELNDKEPTITGEKQVTEIAAIKEDVEVDAVHRGYGRGRGRGRGRGSTFFRGRGGQSGSSTRISGNCYHCGKPGHRKAECRTLLFQQQKTAKTHATEAEQQQQDWNHDPYAVGNETFLQEDDQAAEVSNVSAFDYLN